MKTNVLEEALDPTTEEVAADQTVTYTRKKPRRPCIDESLPREEVLHDIADEDKVCDCCGHDLHRMGEEVSEKLEFIPARARVLRHVRPKYSCRVCEKHGTQTAVKIAPVKPSIQPKSIATPSLLAQIISAKFQFGLPLYRQEAMFKQYGARAESPDHESLDVNRQRQTTTTLSAHARHPAKTASFMG